VGGVFLVDIQSGITTWLAAAAEHEVPQELGDFGILVNGGWEKRQSTTFQSYLRSHLSCWWNSSIFCLNRAKH